MATSRTGTAKWKNLRRRALHKARHDGVTNCPDCGIHLDYTTGKRPNSAEADHVHPHARGGQDTIDNIRVCCRRCNQSKGAKTQTATTAAMPITTIDFTRQGAPHPPPCHLSHPRHSDFHTRIE